MGSEQRPIQGGCLCGAIRFESSAPPRHGYYCHCTICQKAYGGLYSAMLRVPRSGFRFTKGKPKTFRASNFAARSFCSNCGSPMPFFYEGNEHVWIKIGTLDRPEEWPMTKDAPWGPTEHWFIDNRISWEDIDDGLPQLTSASQTQKAAEAHVADKAKEN